MSEQKFYVSFAGELPRAFSLRQLKELAARLADRQSAEAQCSDIRIGTSWQKWPIAELAKA